MIINRGVRPMFLNGLQEKIFLMQNSHCLFHPLRHRNADCWDIQNQSNKMLTGPQNRTGDCLQLKKPPERLMHEAGTRKSLNINSSNAQLAEVTTTRNTILWMRVEGKYLIGLNGGFWSARKKIWKFRSIKSWRSTQLAPHGRHLAQKSWSNNGKPVISETRLQVENWSFIVLRVKWQFRFFF